MNPLNNINMLLLLFLIFNSIQQLVSRSNEHHITITGGDGTTFEQNPLEYNPSNIHIHAKTNSLQPDQDLTIHIHHKNNDQILSDQDRQHANHITNMATMPIISPLNPCQQYINDMNSAIRQKNDMAIHLASLDLKVRQLQQENHLLRQQVYGNQNSHKHTVEVPKIIGDSHRTYQPSIADHSIPVGEHANNSPTIDKHENDQTGHEATTNEGEMDKKAVITEPHQKKPFWTKWSILIFVLLFLIPLMVGLIFFCVSHKANDTKDQKTAFIVDEVDKKNKNVDRDLPFVLNEPQNAQMNDNNYSRQSTSADIQRLSQNLDGYFKNTNLSTKPVISESKDNMEQVNDAKPVVSSNANIRRHSLVDQQMSSSDNGM